MKNLLPFVIILLIYSCQTNQQESAALPPAFIKMLAKHGGLTTWKKMKSLRFQAKVPDGVETHSIDLQNFRDRLDGPGYTMGYDGQAIWVGKDTTFDGNPTLYHSLYFYFFSMPFMPATEGVEFTQAEPLLFDGMDYPGFQVVLDKGVGAELSREFFLHYDPSSHQLAWVGYADPQISGKVNWVRYVDWINTERLVLPTTIAWYKMENGKLTAPKHQVSFDNIEISRAAYISNIFEKPDEALVVQ
ncbi:MAG: hypothetical protein R2825_15505 [Saprospiraceae bacterium]